MIENHSGRPVPDKITAAIFDFDGTLSLLRQNWQGVMIPMMVQELMAVGGDESAEDLRKIVNEFVTRLTGKQTIYQMIQLVEEITKRGGQAKAPLQYKHQYHDLLWGEVHTRIEAVKSNELPVEDASVAGSHDLLSAISSADVPMYLASGTDESYVRNELQVLGMDGFFSERIYGAQDDYKSFSKAMIMAQMVKTIGSGEGIIGFGDGYVEIEEVRKAGGYAIAVASNEDGQPGINSWKRERLIEAGADIIIADYRNLPELLAHLELER